ncbi:hypothetical protein SSX86_023699 [Deinandra increscens subsp. villosa]|uniref:BURP domain-containing protein n=1 Tax=Deinandra increscens subsp. villosa TaxID=3103831 RepID=A0AAP0CLC0_9ASTR
MYQVALVGGSYASVTPEVYWKSVLPKSPMPKSIKDILYTPGFKSSSFHPFYLDANLAKLTNNNYNKYHYKHTDHLKNIDPSVTWFFVEQDLHDQTIEMTLLFPKLSDHKSTFLPRKTADSIPFSSNKLPEIYNMFSVKPGSLEAETMKDTVMECESKSMEGEEKYCATSLESMVDFSITKLGKRVKAISTEVNAKESTIPLQKYKITSVVKKLAADKVVVCHKRNYAYAVFYCHKTVSTQAYTVSLTGVDGTEVKAVAVCHTDTSKWDPEHLAFQVLKVKPGTVPICHIVPEAHVVWVPYQ